MKKLLFLLLFLLLPAWAGAQPSSPGFLSATESDGSPDCYGWQLKFGNGSVTDNGDGTCSVSGSGTSVFWTDPIADYHCAGVATTTTGTISSGTNSLVVASASGWEVGMGIAVANAGAGGTTELITTITNISGTTFTLNNNAAATATGQTVNHDDTACFNNAIASAKNIFLRMGTFNITSQVAISSMPIMIMGSGADPSAVYGTIIVNRGASNNVFNISFREVVLSNLTIAQSGTPTGGYAVYIEKTGGPEVSNVLLDHIAIRGTAGGIYMGQYTIRNFIINSWIGSWGNSSTIAGMKITNDAPYGDLYVDNVEILPYVSGTPGVGLLITSADTNSFKSLKVNGGDPGIKIIDTDNIVVDQRFIDTSVEGGTNSNANVVITAASANRVGNISFVGGENGVSLVGGIDIEGNAKGISIMGVLFHVNQGDDITLNNSNGYSSIVGNVSDNSASGKFFLNIKATDHVTIGHNQFVASHGISTTGAATDVNDIGQLGSNGNLGIGTVNPRQKLDVIGTSQMTGFKLTTGPSTGYVLTSDSVGVGTWAPSSGGGGVGTINSGATNYIPRYTASTTLDDDGVTFVNTGTNVGIGTSNPIGSFEVYGESATKVHAFTVFSDTASNQPLFYFRRGRGTSTSPTAVQSGDIIGSLRFAGQFNNLGGFFTSEAYIQAEAQENYSSTNGNKTDLIFATAGSGTVPAERMRIKDGNVGIGTSTPNGIFVVFGGNVGIGTTNPPAVLAVSGGIRADTASTPRFTLTPNSSGTTNLWNIDNNAGTLRIFREDYSATGAGANGAVRVSILDGGNVGIGTASPVAPLSVTGHFHSHGTAPTVATNDCGTTTQGTVVAKSTDVSGSFTVGTLAVTACAVTFNGAWTNAPNCVATDDSNIIAVKAVATTTKLTVSSVASMSGDVISYICVGNE